MKSKHLSVLMAALTISSCSPPHIDMLAEHIGDRLRVILSQDWGIFFSSKQIPCIKEAGLYPPGTDDRGDAVWLIETEKEIQCLDLASFTVGEAPKNFKQTVPLSAVPNRPYTLRAHGIGWGETEVRL